MATLTSLSDLPEELREALLRSMVKDSGLVTRPIHEAQVDFLQNCWRRYSDPDTPPLQPGDLVREKPGLGTIKSTISNNVILLYLRPLDLNQYSDRALLSYQLRTGIVAADVDCVTLHQTDQGGDSIVLLHSTKLLERYVPE